MDCPRLDDIGDAIYLRWSARGDASYQGVGDLPHHNGGTALPIGLYLRMSEILSKQKSSGNDCILAASSVVNRLYRLFASSTGSVEFRPTFARCELISDIFVIEGLFEYCLILDCLTSQ